MNPIPAIAIEREYGAGGGEVARRLSQKLNIPIYGKDLLEEAAVLANITPREAYQLEEGFAGKVASFISRAFQMIPGVDPEEDYLYQIQAELIRSRSQARPAVFLGRLAQDALKGTGLDYIRIFITRPKEDRIYQVMKKKGLSAEQAEELIDKVDQNRTRRVLHHADRDWGSSENYDLVLNSEELGIDGCVEVIETFVNTRARRRKARGKQ